MIGKSSIICISCLVVMFLLGGCAWDTLDNNAENATNTQLEDLHRDRNLNYRRKFYVAAGYFSYAITNDGKVLKAGNREDIYESSDWFVTMPDVSNWKSMKFISADGYAVCGVDANGNLYGDGMGRDSGEMNLSLYKNCSQIVSDGTTFTILNGSKKIIATGEFTYDWQKVYNFASDVVYVSSSPIHTVILKSDGKVSGYGNNEYGELNIAKWDDIVDISCGYGYTVGLRADGTVLAVGNNEDGQCNVSEWTDIVQVSANGGKTIGLKKDGTVVATGNNEFGQCNVSEWTDIVAVVAGNNHTLGIKKDGTANAIGDNTYGQCDVSSWTNIRVPIDEVE